MYISEYGSPRLAKRHFTTQIKKFHRPGTNLWNHSPGEVSDDGPVVVGRLLLGPADHGNVILNSLSQNVFLFVTDKKAKISSSVSP